MRDSRGFIYSTALHGIILLLLLVGLPDFLHRPLDEEPEAISVDILPVAPKSNVKPQEKPPEKTTKPLAEKTTDRKAVTDAKKEEPKPEKSEAKPQKEDPKPEVKPEAVKPDIVKPKPVKRPDKPKDEKPKPEDDFDKLLSSMKSQSKSEESPKPTQARTDSKAKPARSQVYDSSQPLSMSQKDAIRSQIEKCWNAPIGGRDAQNLIVTLHLELTEDGTVTKAELARDQGRYNSDSFFQAAADAAMRAVKRCSPLKNLPADKYGTWRDMELNFNPHDML